MLDSMLMTAFSVELTKLADDPDAVALPRVKGLPSIRNNGPRLTKGTKGQVPVNPFSGNWVKPPKNILQKAAGAPMPNPLHSALGLAALGGAGYLGYRALKAARDPWSRQPRDPQATAALVHGARGGQYAVGAQPEALLAALR